VQAHRNVVCRDGTSGRRPLSCDDVQPSPVPTWVYQIALCTPSQRVCECGGPRNGHRPMSPLAVGFRSTCWLTNSSTITLALVLSESVPVSSPGGSITAAAVRTETLPHQPRPTLSRQRRPGPSRWCSPRRLCAAGPFTGGAQPCVVRSTTGFHRRNGRFAYSAASACLVPERCRPRAAQSALPAGSGL